jgi:hypothetical protein
MITPERVCEIYHSLMLHFKKESNYNASKYKFRMKNVSIKPGQYWLYQRVAKITKNEENTVIFFIANYIKNGYVFPFISNVKSKYYYDWIETFNKKEQEFKQDIIKLKLKYKNFDSLFELDKNNIAPIIHYVIQEQINYNTVIILNKLTDFSSNCISQLNKSLDLFAYEEYQKIIKISELITFKSENKKKYKQIILDIFSKNP